MIPVIVRKSGPSPFSASSRRLTGRTIQLRDGYLTNATLVPLFDAAGTTAKVALLSPRTRECWVLDWRPGLIKLSLFRKTRVDIVRAERQSAMTAGPLWLHDLTGLVEITLRTLCPGLAVRNAADALPSEVQRLTWRRDLSKISGVWKWDKSGSYNAVKWDPKWLADAEERAVASPLFRPPLEPEVTPKANPGVKTGWVLDPAWAR